MLDVLTAISTIDEYSVLRSVVGRLHGIEELLEDGEVEAAGFVAVGPLGEGGELVRAKSPHPRG